jgi:H+/Cl- antiporter ClcA
MLFAFVLTGWIGIASRVRTQFYRFKNSEYVMAARTLGASDARLIFRHILPNSLGTIITGTILIIPGVIFSESMLTYLGIVNLETSGLTSIGTMLANGRAYLSTFPHIIACPAIFISLLGISMCKVFHTAEHLAAHHIKSPWVRIFAGGVVIALMTQLVGDHRFNGAGMDMALEAVQGHADWYSFLLKMLFTAITLAAGFKGGEIVPTFCIGATFGCVVGGLLGLDAGLCGALGLIGLFCCATNSPIASIVLSIEMFGGANLHLFALVCVICFVLSGNTGLYASQVNQFDKASEKMPGKEP